MNNTWRKNIAAGNAACEQGKHAEAESMFLDALAEAEKFGETDPRLAVSLNNLATVYHSQGKYSLAEPLYKRALAIREKIHGTEHNEIAVNLYNLAVLYSAKRNYLIAEEHYKRALAMKEKLFGNDSPELISTLKHYAQLLKLLGRQDEARLMESRQKDISNSQK